MFIRVICDFANFPFHSIAARRHNELARVRILPGRYKPYGSIGAEPIGDGVAV